MKRSVLWGFMCGCVVSSEANAQVDLVNAFPNLSFAKPVDVQHAGDGSDRLFVVEQEGRIWVFQNDSTTATRKPFLDIADSVYYPDGSEMGLLGLTFHPRYEDNGHFFVHYTKNNPPRSVIARFEVGEDPDSASRTSEEILLEVPQPYTNHNGGQLAFGPDGFLYIALGDGGSGGDPFNNGQTLTTLLGAILRIDTDTTSLSTPYGIPPDNPFAGNDSGFREEIYAYGLRNPWRFSFDPLTGLLWCADVGQSAREEINIILPGGNLGWNIMEGTQCFSPSSGCDTTGLTLPLWDYPRPSNGGSSITGGYVYRGTSLPQLYGSYLFGDYVIGFVAALTFDGMQEPVVTYLDSLPPYRLTSFGTDQQGEIIVCSYSGSLFRLRSIPVTSVHPADIPLSLTLHQNFPNPFNAETRISFSLSHRSQVSLTIYDGVGRAITTLVNGAMEPGMHSVLWNATGLASGIYRARLADLTGGTVQSKTMVLLR